MSSLTVPGLNIIVLTEDAERFRGALMLALTHKAAGGEARLFLQLDAARLLATRLAAPQDASHRAAGLPDLADLLDDALDNGVALIACQTGLALAALPADTLDLRVETGGLLSFLSGVAPTDRLLTV